MKHLKFIYYFVASVLCYLTLINPAIAGDVPEQRQPLYGLSEMARMANAENCASPTWATEEGSAQPAVNTNGTTLTGIEYRGIFSMVTNETWDFVGKTARIKWLADGANNYGSFTIVAAGISAGFFTTDHSWAGSTVIAHNTWYYTTITLNADGSYEAVTATDGYADQGGTLFSSRSGTLTADQLIAAGTGQFKASLNDAYGTSPSITVAETTIDGCGATSTNCSATGWLTTEGTAQPVANTSGTILTGNVFRGVHIMASNETFNFVGKTARIKWQVDGASNYGSFTVYAADMSAGFFTTDHSWNGSTVITSNTWYYTTIALNSDGSYEAVTATDGYADQGGTVFSSRSSTLTGEQLSTASSGQFKASLNDAYGTSPSITVAEATINNCDNGSTDQTTSSDCLFNWAEQTFPDLFSPPDGFSKTYIGYYYRYYSHTQAYLATQNSHVYYLGPIHDNGNTIWDLGVLDGWLVIAGCSQ